MEVEHHHNHLKYSICFIRIGKYVFHKIFHWGYTGGLNSLKETIFNLPGYHNGRYRKDFNEVQREKVDNNIPTKNLNVPLLYKLLQLVCSLSDSENSKWHTESPDSLEYYLNLIYTKYNDMVNEKTNFNDSEICTQIENLREIFINIIQLSGRTFSLTSDELNGAEVWVNKELNSIKELLLTSKTVVECESEVVSAYASWLKEEGYEEASLNVTTISQIVLDPCLNLVNPFFVNDIFINPIISLEKDLIQQRQLSTEESRVNFSELLVNSQKNVSNSDVILMSSNFSQLLVNSRKKTSNSDFILMASNKGMGKSTVIKQISHSFYYEKKNVNGLADFDLSLYLQCNQSTFNSIDDMVASFLPLCSSFLGSRTYSKAFFTLKLLILLDDIDGLTENSLDILEELCTNLYPGSQILATVSLERFKEIENRVRRFNIKISSFDLHGIPESHVQIFCKKFVEQCPISSKIENDKLERLCSLLDRNFPLQKSLKSPEFLTIVALLLAHSSCKLDTDFTISELLIHLDKLLIEKSLEKSLDINGMRNDDNLKNLQEVFQVIGKELLCSLVTGKYFGADNVEKIHNKCLELNINSKEVVSSFLGFCGDQDSSLLEIFHLSSYHRKLYYAASYITLQILKNDKSPQIMEVLDSVLPDEDIALESSTFQRIIKIVIGILESNGNEHLNQRASEITSILKESGVTNSTDWIQYIKESKDNKALVDEILKEMGCKWEIEDQGMSQTLIFLLRYKPPSSLSLTVNENPSNYQCLLEAVQICSKLSINLSLHFSYHFLTEKEAFSDKYLEALKRGSLRCKLESFRGRLSMSSISQIPRAVKSLSLHVNPSMIGFLNARLPSLINQPDLHLNLDVAPGTSPSSIPALKANGMNVTVDLWNIDGSSLEWSCELIQALSSSFMGLSLQNCNLNSRLFIKWLRNLNTREVYISKLTIFSREDLSEEEEKKLQNYSKILGCYKFVWVSLQPKPSHQ